jgi:hypothetical protein
MDYQKNYRYEKLFNDLEYRDRFDEEQKETDLQEEYKED